MPDRPSPSVRRRKLCGAVALRAWSGGWVPRLPGRASPSRRVVSLVVSALMMLATLVVGLTTVAPLPAHADTASPGLPDVTIQTAAVPMTNAANSATNATAGCPSGTLVGGGAFLQRTADANPPNNGLKLNGSIPSDPAGNPVTNNASTPSNWTAVGGFGGQSESGDQVTGFADCASGGPTATTVVVSTPVGVATEGNAPIKAIATCPSGTRLLSGGALGVPASQGSFKPIASYPSDATGNPASDAALNPDSWSAYGSAGAANSSDQVTAYAVCSTDATINIQVARVDAPGPVTGSTFTTTTASCVSGDRLLGGGVLTDEGLNVEPQQGVHLRGSYPATDTSGIPATNAALNPNSWTGVAQAGGSTPAATTTTRVFALCAAASSVQVPTGAIGGILLTGIVAVAFVGYQLSGRRSRRRTASS